MKNIVLIGMPGAGKSTIGVLLAKSLGMAFVDTDIIIQKTENKLLQNIIKDDGLEGFLKIEEKVILDCTFSHTVVATGGSVVKSQRAMEWLKKQGVIYYLLLDHPSIEKRIRNITTRGIVMEKGQSLKDVFEERKPLYERYSDYTIDCRKRSAEQIVSIIKEHFSELMKAHG